MVKLARRFCPDWMIQADGTFNTNAIKMPLIDMIGVTNTGETFPFAFCFVTSERGDAWRFTFQCLAECIFPDIPLPLVVIADQGLGLRSVFADVWPSATLQFCEWHAAQNIKKRLAEKKYSKKDRDEIMDLVWAYIWSATEDELERNRAGLMARIREGECEYIRKNWIPKERQVIRC
jgi:MULE transposase domain